MTFRARLSLTFLLLSAFALLAFFLLEGLLLRPLEAARQRGEADLYLRQVAVALHEEAVDLLERAQAYAERSDALRALETRDETWWSLEVYPWVADRFGIRFAYALDGNGQVIFRGEPSGEPSPLSEEAFSPQAPALAAALSTGEGGATLEIGRDGRPYLMAVQPLPAGAPSPQGLLLFLRPADDALLKEIGGILGAQVALYGPDGTLQAPSSPPPLLPARLEEEGPVERRLEVNGAPHLLVQGPLPEGEVRAAALFPDTAPQGILSSPWTWRGLALLFSLLLAGLGSLPLALLLLRPLGELTEALSPLEEGRWTVQLPVREDEWGRLHRRIGRALEEIGAREEALRETEGQLQRALAREESLRRRLERRLREVKSLFAIGQAVAAAEGAQEVAEVAVREIRRGVGSRSCTLFLRTPDGDYLELVAADGLAPDADRAFRIRVGEELAGRVAAMGQPLYLADARQAPIPLHLSAEVRSLFGVPVFLGEAVAGVLAVDARVEDAFDEESQRFVEAAAALVSLALERASLLEELRGLGARLETALNGARDALLLLSPEGEIQLLNEGARRALGIPRPASGTPLKEVMDPEAPLAVLWEGARQVGEAAASRIPAPDGRVFFFSALPVRGPGKEILGWVLAGHDVTALEEADRIRSQTVQGAVQELKGPLAAIQGYAQLILVRDGEALPERAREALEKVAVLSERLTRIVEDMGLFARMEDEALQVERTPLNWVDAVREVLAEAEPLAREAGVHLTAALPEEPLWVEGDGALLRRALTHLVLNGIRYTGEGGQVLVQVGAAGEEVLTHVVDTGPGIPLEEQSRIFERFYRGREGRRLGPGGAGLGLPLARAIVEAHEGQLWLRSELGKGSVFSFRLRRIPPPEGA